MISYLEDHSPSWFTYIRYDKMRGLLRVIAWNHLFPINHFKYLLFNLPKMIYTTKLNIIDILHFKKIGELIPHTGSITK